MARSRKTINQYIISNKPIQRKGVVFKLPYGARADNGLCRAKKNKKTCSFSGGFCNHGFQINNVPSSVVSMPLF